MQKRVVWKSFRKKADENEDGKQILSLCNEIVSWNYFLSELKLIKFKNSWVSEEHLSFIPSGRRIQTQHDWVLSSHAASVPSCPTLNCIWVVSLKNRLNLGLSNDCQMVQVKVWPVLTRARKIISLGRPCSQHFREFCWSSKSWLDVNIVGLTQLMRLLDYAPNVYGFMAEVM